MRTVLSVLLCVLAFNIQAQFADTVKITSTQHKKLSEYFYYYIDPTKSVTIDELATLPKDTLAPVNESALRLDLLDANIWLTLALQNQLGEKEEFIIEFDDPSLFSITLYKRKNNVFKVARSGTSVRPEEKHPPGNKNNFKITLEPNQVIHLAFKVSSKSSMTLSATLKKEDLAEIEYLNQNVWLGAYYAILILLILYSLFLNATTKIKSFLYYAFYVLNVGLFTAAADGFLAKFLHEVIIILGGYHDIIFFTSSSLLGLAFMSVFLNIQKWSPQANQFIRRYAFVLTITIFAFFFISKPLMLVLVQVFGLITPALYIVFGFMAVKRKIDQSLYYLIAYLVFAVFVVIFTLSMFRVIAFTPIVQYSIHIGYFLSIIILSYGLIQRLSRVYEKLLEKEKEKKDIIKQKNKELEQKVAQRTAEIAKKEVNLRSILDNTDNSIWLIDEEYKLIDFNRIFAFLWQVNFDVELVKGKSILKLMPNQLHEKWKKQYDNNLAGNKSSFIDAYEFRGKKHYFEIRGFPIIEGEKVKGVAYFSKDITEQLNAEKQLKNQNAMLKKVNKELDSFVYSASHDLKAPLASVLGLINLVRVEKNMEQRQEYYGMMEQSIIRLDTFIKDIIDYSRNERTTLTYDPITFDEILKNVFQDLKYISQTDNVTKETKVTGNHTFKNDPVRIRVILRNLISNAIKYGCGNEDRENKISVEIVKSEKEATITITDFGKGIEQKHIPHLFEMFYRAHEESSGTGLGLYIVKETVEKLNGTIVVNSKPEQGTQFIVTIPNGKR